MQTDQAVGQGSPDGSEAHPDNSLTDIHEAAKLVRRASEVVLVVGWDTEIGDEINRRPDPDPNPNPHLVQPIE